jgi:2-hydroxy-3-keto-5-methylthiopentenyl-1-phosphate phosphatase
MVPRYPGPIVEICALVVDFDGTVCIDDVSEALLDEFGEGDWRAHDDAVDRGEIGLRHAAELQATMLRAPSEQMLAFVLHTFSLHPTFPPFAAWAEREGLPLTIVSDGFGFYVRPMLHAAGLGRLEVMTNTYEGGRLGHPHGHPICVGCGTCKMLAVQSHRERHGPVAFIGEGQSDRYGALFSDLVFAKKDLVRICRQDGVRYREWETFDDVRAALQSTDAVPGPAGPERCPGWRTDGVSA